MPGMNDSEAWAIRKMANAAKRSNSKTRSMVGARPYQQRHGARLGVWLVHGGPPGRHDHMRVAVDQGRDIGTVCLRRVLLSEIVKPKRIKCPWAGQCQSGQFSDLR